MPIQTKTEIVKISSIKMRGENSSVFLIRIIPKISLKLASNNEIITC